MSIDSAGGPAFPGAFLNDSDVNVTAPDGQLVPPGYTVQMQGMTLRDYFAAKAMHAFLSSDREDVRLYGVDSWAEAYLNAAVRAYGVADALIAVRKQ